jgi:protocatechuate 3,4-dioxygenase beta subunit
MDKSLLNLRLWILLIMLAIITINADAGERCEPTKPDADGPFYRAGAPQRNQVGEGYILSGSVLSTVDCSPLVGARVEIWLNGPDGKYSDQWRATLYADNKGRYRFESHLPVPYGSRPPHIHIIVNAAGHAELITQYYPQPDTSSATFDLVLIPGE